MRPLLLLVLCATVGASDLLLCVITSHRDHSYLQALIDGLYDENASFLVVDVDNSTAPEDGYLRLQEAPHPCAQGPVPCPVQRQALDIVRGLQACANAEPSYPLVGLIEDDMIPCDGSLEVMRQTLETLQDFKTARFAKFSRAVILPRSNIPLYSKYVAMHVHQTPYDILLNFDWAGGEDYIHPVSLFAHQGQVSTIEERNDPDYLVTYSTLRDETCGTPLLGK
jgi:hypothetical protein